MLASLTLAESAVGRSTTTRDNHSPRRCPGAGVLLDIMRSEDAFGDTSTSDIAFRLGLGLASVRTPRDSSVPRGRGLRELLLPISSSAGVQVWTDSAIIPTPGSNHLESLLTEALRWQTQFRESGFDATTLSWIGRPDHEQESESAATTSAGGSPTVGSMTRFCNGHSR